LINLIWDKFKILASAAYIVQIADRSLIWNSNLIETLELQNLISQAACTMYVAEARLINLICNLIETFELQNLISQAACTMYAAEARLINLIWDKFKILASAAYIVQIADRSLIWNSNLISQAACTMYAAEARLINLIWDKFKILEEHMLVKIIQKEMM